MAQADSLCFNSDAPKAGNTEGASLCFTLSLWVSELIVQGAGVVSEWRVQFSKISRHTTKASKTFEQLCVIFTFRVAIFAAVCM